MNRFEGLLNASAEKRYKHFISYTTDNESVWVLENEYGYASIELDGYIHMLLYPSKEFAEYFSNDDAPAEIEIHEFYDMCSELVDETDVRFMVFPNDEDCMIVDAVRLIDDLKEELDLLE